MEEQNDSTDIQSKASIVLDFKDCKDYDMFQRLRYKIDKEFKKPGIFPILEQRLSCEYVLIEDQSRFNYGFKWTLSNDEKIVDGGVFFDTHDDERSKEESKRFWSILEQFDLPVREAFLSWYEDSFFTSVGIIIKRAFVCDEISNISSSNLRDRIYLNRLNKRLNHFIHPNVFVDVNYCANRVLKLNYDRHGIHYVITSPYGGTSSRLEVVAIKDGKTIESSGFDSFVGFHLDSFVCKTEENLKKLIDIEESIKKECKKIIERHLFEDIQQGKKDIEKEINAYLDSLVGNREISSYELSCKVFEENNIYVGIICSKDGVFHELEIQTITQCELPPA